MKKFLSLVLAMIMAMSLVTISAGATEYKDLTDKDEIQYEEAVAVLNRIGVITGYDDGSFRPEGELTRGAAAKIIVSLLIGPEAANNLPNTYAPYPDVPANHTFAGVISYCKTAGIISGYGDGTFKPANSLTGYAFAKMLLGAIGYDSKIQGYTDTGWTMNVARDGNVAGLFNRIEFDGAAAVNREQACQLALNTLKATMVEYSGGLTVTAGDATVTSMPTLSYKISNQAYARNISNRKATNYGNVEVVSHYTVEFGEEHFKDLRLNDEHGTNPSDVTSGNMARDSFGRPSNVWSYKKVTIGTFPIDPDYIYTELMIHNDDVKVTDASKVRALGLAGYELKKDASAKNTVDTVLYVNGMSDQDGGEVVQLANVANIADYTDNGTIVEVYVDEDDADFINTVVVVKTQLMEVKAVKSESVSLVLYDEGSADNGKGSLMGFNSTAINKKVNDVEVNDDCYSVVKDLKAGDIVAIIPVYAGDKVKYDVAGAYVPETVTGELSSVDTYGTLVDGKEDKSAIALTVGGTDYDIALWNKKLHDISGEKIRVTRKDVTLYLDLFGNAMTAKNIGSTSDWMIVGGYHSGLVDGAVVTFVDGWDIKGNEISLNIGNINYDYNAIADANIGDLVRYTTNATDRYAEWDIDYTGVFDVASMRPDEISVPTLNPYSLKGSSGKVLLNSYVTAAGAYNDSKYPKDNDSDSGYVGAYTKNVPVDDDGIKVIYVSISDDKKEVDSIEIKSGMQSISNEEIQALNSDFNHKRAQACVNLKDGAVNENSVVKAIVVKLESSSASLKDLVYISNYAGSASKQVGTDKNTKPVYGYEVHFIGTSDWDDTVTIYSYKNMKIGTFARARQLSDAPTEVKNVTEDNFYNLTAYGDSKTGDRVHKALSVLDYAEIQEILKNNKTLLRLMNYGWNGPAYVPGMGAELYDKDDTANISLNIDPEQLLDLGDEKAAGIVSIRGAKIIDLTGNGVTSASNLKELWEDVSETQLENDYRRMIKVSLVFNDKYNDDDFRDVYALIITSAKEKDIYDYVAARPAEEEVEKITAEIVLDDLEIGPDGATYTVDIDEDGYPIEGTEVVTMSRAANKAIGTLTITFNGNGKITDVTIEYKPDVDSDKVVVAVRITVGGEELEKIPVGAEEIPDVTVENFTPVAVAEVDENGKITGIKYNTAKAGDGSLKLVDKDGNEIGAVTVTPNEEDPTAEPNIKVTIDNEKAEDAGIEVPAEGETIPVVGVDEEGNEGEPVEVTPEPEEPGPDEPAVVANVSIKGLPLVPVTGKEEITLTATAEDADGNKIAVKAVLEWDDEATPGEGDDAAATWGYTVTVTIDADADAKFDDSTEVDVADEFEVVDDKTITFTGAAEYNPDYSGPEEIVKVTVDTSDISDITEGDTPEDMALTATAEDAAGNEYDVTAELVWDAAEPETQAEDEAEADGEDAAEGDEEAATWGYTITITVDDPAAAEFTDATEVVDGEDAAIEGAEFVDAGTITIEGEVNIVPAPEPVTLTLSNVFDGAKVYLSDGTQITGETVMVEGVPYTEYAEIPAGSAVSINLASVVDLTTLEDTEYDVDGVTVTQNATKKVITIAELTKSITLEKIKTSTEANDETIITLHFDSGITVGKFYKDTADVVYGEDHVPVYEEVDPIEGSDTENGEYKFYVGDEVIAIKLTAQNAKHVFAVSDADTKMIIEAAGNWGEDQDGTDLFRFDLSAGRDMWFHEAVKITADTTAAGVGIEGSVWKLAASENYAQKTDKAIFVAPGETVALTLPEGSGAITGVLAAKTGEAAGTLTGEDVIANGLPVGTDDLVLIGAYKVEAETGISLKVAASNAGDANSGTAIESGAYVKKGSLVGAYATGEEVAANTAADAIDAADGATYALAAVGNNASVTADMDIKKATKVSIGDATNNITLEIKTDDGYLFVAASSSAAKDVYVIPNENVTYKVTGSSTTQGDALTFDGVTAKTNSPSGGSGKESWATFVVTEYDAITIVEETPSLSADNG